MKKLKRNISLALLIMAYCSAFSQGQDTTKLTSAQQHSLELHKRALNGSAYIFEGKVTDQKTYLNKKGEQWTCSTFKITKVFKGSLTLGSIKVVTFQSTGSQKVEDGGAQLYKNSTYVIVANAADSSKLNAQMTVTDNAVSLFPRGIIEITSDIFKGGKLFKAAGAEWIGGYRNPGTVYKSVNDFYSFLQGNGITVQLQISTAPADGTKH